MNVDQILNLDKIIPQNGDTSALQSYIEQIQDVQSTLSELYSASPASEFGMDIGQYQEYADILKDVEPAQAAVILSTQGLTNAQIQQTLACMTNAETNEALTASEQYQAMADAGLVRKFKSFV